MLNFKEFNLVRYSEDEIVFSSRRDLVNAIQEFSSGNDIVVTYRDGNKLCSIIIMASCLTKFRNGDLLLSAEEELQE
ncbi:MAG: hypothetical protein KAX49_16905 [Halanaerobiales bacterium]|nr:hypothetical protein [Halanaerobiales bacterium]